MRLVLESKCRQNISFSLFPHFLNVPTSASSYYKQAPFFLQLVNSGEDVLVFYNDRASFQTLIQMMRSERDRMDENSPLMYHIHLVELLAVCTEGKNVYTEIKCNSLLPLDDIVRVVTHEDCIPEVSKLFSRLCMWHVDLQPAPMRPHSTIRSAAHFVVRKQHFLKCQFSV